MLYRAEIRPTRIEQDNACYFVTGGTQRRERLVDTEQKLALAQGALQEAAQLHNIRLYAWTILSNHYHVLIKGGEDTPVVDFVRQFHETTAMALNEIDHLPGRPIWYQYWDVFSNGGAEFWAYFNFIHLNPLRHGYVKVPTGVWASDGRRIEIEMSRYPDLHQSLSEYPYSSYHYYEREYGKMFLNDAWMRYPIPDNIEHDSF